MSFICVICRDLLKITEESSPRHNAHHHLVNPHAIANHVSSTNTSTATATATAAGNSASGRKKEKNNSIVATKCGHLFHYPCLSVWLSQSMNLTTDSKMRCPSCKQLIYIYELVQLFPVESTNAGCGSDLENIFSDGLQQKMKCVLEQLEYLVRDLGNNVNGNAGSPAITKGSETTPTRLQRIRDSPKKGNAAAQLTEISKGVGALRDSMKELNGFMERHAELGSVVETQEKEISELKLQNKRLKSTNDMLTLKSNAEEAQTKTKTAQPDNEEGRNLVNVPTATAPLPPAPPPIQPDPIHNVIADTKEAQENGSSLEASPAVPLRTNSETGSKIASSNNNKEHRKSVSFLDPFIELDEFTSNNVNNNGSIPFDKKDLRIGDKVIWHFEGRPEIGTVKWKGFIGSQINVGVEFERQLGLPIKDLSSDAIQCIFKSKPGHGRILPVHELTSYNKKTYRDSNNLLKARRSKSTECVLSAEDNGGNRNKWKPVCSQQ